MILKNNLYENREIAGKTCYIGRSGKGADEGGSVIYWGMFPFEENEVDHFWECLREAVPEKDFLLVAFQVDDWNREFSPWSAPAPFENETFDGEGRQTLNDLTEKLIPQVETEYNIPEGSKKFLIGYSLAGLFSLWAGYETSLFAGIACCSGSLWFEGWEAYAKSHTLSHPCDVYLSLGGKEEKTSNPVMATIGRCTRAQEKILKADPNAGRVVLEWNSGGHFADSGKRLAKAVKWLLG